jgi:hypothetical protein
VPIPTVRKWPGRDLLRLVRVMPAGGPVAEVFGVALAIGRGALPWRRWSELCHPVPTAGA